MVSTKIERGLVVVGVDGSEQSIAALHWAARYAAASQAFPGGAGIEARVSYGHPAQVLIEESKEADLLHHRPGVRL
jgi:nucleotide-binding universal stress UspA family protein